MKDESNIVGMELVMRDVKRTKTPANKGKATKDVPKETAKVVQYKANREGLNAFLADVEKLSPGKGASVAISIINDNRWYRETANSVRVFTGSLSDKIWTVRYDGQSKGGGKIPKAAQEKIEAKVSSMPEDRQADVREKLEAKYWETRAKIAALNREAFEFESEE